MDELIEDLDYSMWDGRWGCDIGHFRIQLGNIVSHNQIADGLFLIDFQMKTQRINLLEKMENGDYIWWGMYHSRRSCLDALKSLLELQCFTQEAGKPFKDYEEKGKFNEAPF